MMNLFSRHFQISRCLKTLHLHFNYINSGGSLNVVIEDSEGAKFSKEFALNALSQN